MAFKMPGEAEILAQIAAARERERIADETEPRAESAWYDRGSERVFMELKNGCLFAFPAQLGQGLRGASHEQLSAVEVLPGGEALHWEELDADLGVPELLSGMFGSKAWMRELGRAGGQVKSEAKAKASRENGKKGGRPRKVSAAQPAAPPAAPKRRVA